MGKKNKQTTSNKRPSSSLSSSHSSSHSSSLSSSPKFIFFSGIIFGIVVAAAVGVAFFLPSSSLSSFSFSSFSSSAPKLSSELQSGFEKLSQIRQQAKSISDPLKSANFLASSLAQFEKFEKIEIFETVEFSSLLDDTADAQHRAKRFEISEKLHQRALDVKLKERNREKITPNDLVFSFVALATDLFSGGKTKEALEQTQKAYALVSKLPNMARSRIAAMLARLDSAIFECEADFVSALHRFEHSLSLQPTTPDDKKKHMERLHTHRDLLRKVLAYHPVPENIAKKMKERESEVEKELMGMGDWITNMQLPKIFLPNLASKPWHDINDYPQLREAYDIVLKSFPSIREEYFELNSNSLLTQQGECIHDKNRGKWAVHDITSYWVPKDNENKGEKEEKERGKEREIEGCSIYAPSACKLFRELKSSGFPVIRAGYSAIAPTAWIRPHFGMTNGQLKFHLGLVVPKKEGVDCAFMRVGDQIRPWQEGQISFFDDSYEHEVWNNCTTDRAVFQVVFKHPDLPPSSSFSDLFLLPSH